jgi:pimeloyl-ACP methyl ester carboxylesterase
MARRHARQALGTYLRQYVLAPRYRREQRLVLTTEDGVRLSAWRIDGSASAPCTVVLVHGFTNWSRSPRVHAFAQHLARTFHVVVPDLRGHGHSEGVCSRVCQW